MQARYGAERKGYKRGTARNLLHSFPLSGTPVVQSYWTWSWGPPERRTPGTEGSAPNSKDAAFLLTVGSFLLTVELFCLQLTILAFLLTIGAFLLTVLASLLTVEVFSYSGKCI